MYIESLNSCLVLLLHIVFDQFSCTFSFHLLIKELFMFWAKNFQLILKVHYFKHFGKSSLIFRI